MAGDGAPPSFAAISRMRVTGPMLPNGGAPAIAPVTARDIPFSDLYLTKGMA